jgi:hypothetical protein
MIQCRVASNDRTTVIGSGSIDNRITHDSCCEILEGGKRAFKICKEIYKI